MSRGVFDRVNDHFLGRRTSCERSDRPAVGRWRTTRRGAGTRRAPSRTRTVPAYTDEPGVDPARETETFAEVVLHVENWRWAGMPFRLRSGKALGHDRREVRLRFRQVPHLTFGRDQAPHPDELRLAVDPDGRDTVALAVNVNGPGDPFVLDPTELSTALPPSRLPPYSEVLLGALTGDPTLSIRGDEAEESWRIVDPVLAVWRDGAVPLDAYAAGSAGPTRRPQ